MMHANSTQLTIGAVPWSPFMDSSTNFWGTLIKRLRAEQHVSQRQLSSRAKVNRSTLRRIEDGEARGDIDIIERLLNYLGYELEAMAKEGIQQRLKKQAQIEANKEQRAKLAASRLLHMNMKDPILF